MLMKRPRKRACSTVPGLYRIGLRLVFSFLFFFFKCLTAFFFQRWFLDLDMNWISIGSHLTCTQFFIRLKWLSRRLDFGGFRRVDRWGGGACWEHLFNCYRFRCGMIGDGEDG